MSRRGYHHGNLRDALVTAALDLIGKKGVSGLTFADAARRAGVSPAAPYRHFSDRDALLAEVATRGFAKFGDSLAAAWDGGAPDVWTAFQRVGRAYLAFARDEPAYYAAMFESGLPPNADPALSQAADRAFDMLLEAAQALCARLPADRRPPPKMMALHVWSFSHGIASLFGRGDEARRKLPMPPEDLLEAGMLIYMQGLGAGPGGPEEPGSA